MKLQPQQFPNLGFMFFEFEDEEIKPVVNEVRKMFDNNFQDDRDFSKHLAGNLENEYELHNVHSDVSKLVLPIYHKYRESFALFSPPSLTMDVGQIFLGKDLWVNFQKKHEFQPFHIHPGVVSFVIWLEIPFKIQTEKQNIHSKNSTTNVSGQFSFFYTNALGQMKPYYIAADGEYKNKGLMFPSTMPHAVYPFFTSEGYRVSVSGNLFFELLKDNINQSHR